MCPSRRCRSGGVVADGRLGPSVGLLTEFVDPGRRSSCGTPVVVPPAALFSRKSRHAVAPESTRAVSRDGEIAGGYC